MQKLCRAALAWSLVLGATTHAEGQATKASTPESDRGRDLQADVVVFDSTPGGLIAAVAAAQSGRSVIVVTEDKHIGGMQTSGLGNTNAGQRDTVGGLTREFHERIHKYYVTKYGSDSPQVIASADGFHFEPHVAEKIYVDWLAEAGVTCLTEEPLAGVTKDGTRIVALQTATGREIRGAVFIDASYEGDLFAAAGCSHRIGREAASEYGESLAGVRFPPEKLGEADAKLQAYDYRLCLTDDPTNRVPFRKPANYDRTTYAFEAATFRADPPKSLHYALPLNMMPNRKTDSRTAEWVGHSWTYPEADRAERRKIGEAHRAYAEGYLWFLLHDESVPSEIREALSQWGYARDEFVDNDNWPYHLYVREARRLVGDYVMTERDATTDRFKPDAVAIGSFYLDVHPVERVPNPAAVGGLEPEGRIGNVRVKPYEIPYRVLLPKRAEAENLLAPVCPSTSHIAFSTVRMEPVFMMLGHACGLAAAMSLDENKSLHDLPTDRLRGKLVEQGQVIDARPFDDFWPFRKP